jgi:epoxyqueuosine reductase
MQAAKPTPWEYAEIAKDTSVSESPLRPKVFDFRFWRPQTNTKNQYANRGAAGSMPDSSPHPAAGLTPMMNLVQVRAWARDAGFAEAGLIALPHAREARDASRFEDWVRAGRSGTMHYLKRSGENGQLLRARVGVPFPWARSAVVCLANYHSAQPLSTEPAGVGNGWIARYAWASRMDASGERRPSDYHKVLLKRLKVLEARLRAEHGEFEARTYVDTGPVVERSLAETAGLGWTGKNACLIHPQLGSYGFLAVLLTSLQVENEAPPLTVPDRCGSCRRCLDACPTDALFAPYQMDATRCISYLTIEHRGEIAPELMAGMGRQVFGCDICQDVCPWNRKAPVSADPELEARSELVNPTLEWLAQLEESEFERQFNGSPVRRAGFLGLRRNVAIAMGNSGQDGFAPRLREWASQVAKELDSEGGGGFNPRITHEESTPALAAEGHFPPTSPEVPRSSAASSATDDGLRAAVRWALEKLRASKNPPNAS